MVLSLLLWKRFFPALIHGGLAGGPGGVALTEGDVDMGAGVFASLVGGGIDVRIEPPPAADWGGLAFDAAPGCVGSPLVSVEYAAYPDVPWPTAWSTHHCPKRWWS